MRPYYGHPPACTCVACSGAGPRRSTRGDTAPPRKHPPAPPRADGPTYTSGGGSGGRGRGRGAWIVLLIVAVIGAAVFIGSNPDIQSEITAFLDGLRSSGATPPPPTPPQAAPQPTSTPVPPTPTPAPPFEWATVVTPQSRALKSGDVPASGYHAGWFGSLSEDAFTYDGRTYNVLEVLYRESEGELSVRLDSCLRPNALYALRRRLHRAQVANLRILGTRNADPVGAANKPFDSRRTNRC